MVDPAPDGFGLRLPPNSVINGAAGEERDGRERENPQSDAPLEAIGGSYKYQASDQAQGGHDEMDNSPKFWLFRRELLVHY